MRDKFVARVLPRGKPNHETVEDLYDTFTQEELRRLRIRGKPLSIEHKEKKFRIGTVTRDWVGEDGGKYIEGELYNNFEGIFTSEGIFDRYHDVSLAHAWYVSQGSDGSMFSVKKPIEVSVCQKGRRPGTHIFTLSRAVIPHGTRVPMDKTPSDGVDVGEELGDPDVCGILAEIDRRRRAAGTGGTPATASDAGADDGLFVRRELPGDVLRAVREFEQAQAGRDPVTGALPAAGDGTADYLVSRFGPPGSEDGRTLPEEQVAALRQVIRASMVTGGSAGRRRRP